MMRVGQGYDLHRVGPGDVLILGGVPIRWDRALVGHSDADVLIHAIIDAFLGALALGDIGQWFPPTDPSYRGISSVELLAGVLRDPRASGWRVGNVDSTVVAEAPRLAMHTVSIRESLARLLSVSVDRVSVKAKTGEGVGVVGRGEAIEAHAVLVLFHEGR